MPRASSLDRSLREIPTLESFESFENTAIAPWFTSFFERAILTFSTSFKSDDVFDFTIANKFSSSQEGKAEYTRTVEKSD